MSIQLVVQDKIEEVVYEKNPSVITANLQAIHQISDEQHMQQGLAIALHRLIEYRSLLRRDSADIQRDIAEMEARITVLTNFVESCE